MLVSFINVRTIFNRSLHIHPIFLKHKDPGKLVYSKINVYLNQCLRESYHTLMISATVLKIFNLQRSIFFVKSVLNQNISEVL